MEHKTKIKQLIKEGKISANQATVLLSSLDESERRKGKIFRAIADQKKQRQHNSWGFLAVWSVFVLIAVSLSVLIFNSRNLVRDERRALANFNQAGSHMANNDYQKVIEYCKKGIRKAPNFSLGYTLLGVAYKNMYTVSKDTVLLKLSNESFEQAYLLSAKEGGAKMNGTGVFFLSIFIFLILSIISIVFLVLHNVLVKREEKVNLSWAQVGTLYQRKLDLIPALLEAMREYAKHEQQTLESVVQARNRAQNLIESVSGISDSSKEKIREFVSAQQEIAKGIGKLNVLAENYPQLKADVHYLTMHKQIAETVDLITKAKQRYNAVVKGYNSGLRLFPMNLMAVFFQFQPKEYIDADRTVN